MTTLAVLEPQRSGASIRFAGGLGAFELRSAPGVACQSVSAEVSSMSDSVDFDRFFELHYGPMVRSLSAAFSPAEDVAESVQEAFIKAYARWGRVQRYDLPQAWVRRVAINRLRDHARRAQRQQRVLGRLGGPKAVPEPEPEHNPVVALLRELPERQRTAMALFYVEDVAVAEIAASMKISQGAVKAHLAQGRRNLREAALAAGLDVPPLGGDAR